MKKRVILIILVLLSFLSVSSQVRLKTESSDYKNQSISFYTISDYITNLKDTVLEVKTNAKGGFDTSINIKQYTTLFVDLGVYHCFIYLNPKTPYYLIRLPEKREKTKAEELNLFFQPIEYPIAILNAKNTDINKLILTFDAINDQFVKEHSDSIFRFPNKQLIDTYLKDIDNYYSAISNSFFKSYVHYAIYYLYYAGVHRSYETISKKFYNARPIWYNNSNYMRLFNDMYDNIFAVYRTSKYGKYLEKSVKYARSIKALKKAILRNIHISDERLAELIVLKGIHDEFYNRKPINKDPLPVPQLDIILDSIALYSPIKEHRHIAKNIQKKKHFATNKRLAQALNFQLKDLKGNTVTFNDFLGKYIYLNFQRSDVISSMESMDRLIPLYKKYKDNLEIITIFANLVNTQMIDTKKYPWVILQLNHNKQVIRFYNQITWPQFYLINPQGKIIAFPAKSPKEGFSAYFSYILSK